MGRKSVLGAVILAGLTSLVSFIMFLTTPADAHYGVFPKFMGSAFCCAIGMIPVFVWIGVACLRSLNGKVLLYLQAGIVLGFLGLNVLVGGFAPKVLSFVFLAGGLIGSIPIAVLLLCHSWRQASETKSKEPNQQPEPTPLHGSSLTR